MTKSVDPADVGPCYDLCPCDHCWKGWSISPQRKVVNRLMHIVFNDVEVEHISMGMAHDKIKSAVDYLRNTMRDALMETAGIAEVYLSIVTGLTKEEIEADRVRINELRKVGKPDV